MKIPHPNNPTRILGIDPGTNRVGYGLLEKDSGSLKVITYGLIEITPKTDPHKRIIELGRRFKKLLLDTKPDWVGIEKLFFAKNQKTAMSVSEARGILLFLSLEKNIRVMEHLPQAVKVATTNYGLADKKAVAHMVEKILNMSLNKEFDDVSDALAIAIATSANLRLTELSTTL